MSKFTQEEFDTKLKKRLGEDKSKHEKTLKELIASHEEVIENLTTKHEKEINTKVDTKIKEFDASAEIALMNSELYEKSKGKKELFNFAKTELGSDKWTEEGLIKFFGEHPSFKEADSNTPEMNSNKHEDNKKPEYHSNMSNNKNLDGFNNSSTEEVKE